MNRYKISLKRVSDPETMMPLSLDAIYLFPFRRSSMGWREGAFLLALAVLSAPVFPHPQPVSSAGAGIISADSIEKHVRVLGHDSLRGRATGSPGERKAAEYLAGRLASPGLNPRGDHHSYFQAIPMHGSTPTAECELRLFFHGAASRVTVYDFELGEEYLLYRTGAQTFIPIPVPLVFVGYGIVAPEFDYNDYQSLNVEGKIVVFLSGEPGSTNPEYFGGDNLTIYASPEAKQRLAVSRGALGSILIPAPEEQREGYWARMQKEFSFEDVQLAYASAGNLSVLIHPEAAEKLFQQAPYSLQEVWEMHRRRRLKSFALEVNLSFKGDFIQRDFIAHNVLAGLEGRDPHLKDSYLILTAHYDHLGIGPAVDGDSIYNGVFDNAAGVAALLEIARAFAALPQPPKRSLIFLFVTGEEKGLLGSRYYLDHPAVPLSKTVANVNIDGLAMFENFSSIVGIGAELSTLGKTLEQVARKAGLRISAIPPEFAATESFARSDQVAFAGAGIPSILVMDGIDYPGASREEGLKRLITWNETVYHTPFDDLRQPMNFAAAEQHARFLFEFIHALAEENSEPEWYPGAPYRHIRLRNRAEKR